MSSFEPLFGTQGAARIAPRVAELVAAPRVDLWMPLPVGQVADRRASVFEVELSDTHEADVRAQRAVDDEAAAAARVAELDETYLRGVNDGREQGELAERARLRGAMMAAESALDDVRAGEARWLSSIEENIAAIAIGVAQQLVAREVSSSSDVVLGLVSRAVQEFGLDQALSIRVNPNDLESLHSVERDANDEMHATTRGREVRWLSDARIEPGGCVVEGRERIVDGRVDTGLERLYRRLTYTNA
ncbi:MAG TPA: FliH/SctL family protein [Gemmatimonadaceae bacterium]|nr:FliH/SctL family protein [Gemmatimonadaceae bacterium]